MIVPSVDDPVGEILERLSEDLSQIDLKELPSQVYTYPLHELVSICADRNIRHPEWGMLAGRLAMLDLRRTSGRSFSQTTQLCHKQLDSSYYTFVMQHSKQLDEMIVDELNFGFDMMGFSTLKKSYLMRRKEEDQIIITEEPEQMYLRVATYLWYPNLQRIKRCYQSLSNRRYVHASPTLFNAGHKRPQLASCFLLHMADSMDSISKTWKDCAIISKNSGGIGIDLNSIRHSEIGETGSSRGIVPLIKVIEKIVSYVDQCFAPQTCVYTERGLIAMGELRIQDRVMGRDGQFRPIRKIMRYPFQYDSYEEHPLIKPIFEKIREKVGLSGEILHDLTVDDSISVLVTGGHKILATADHGKSFMYIRVRDLEERVHKILFPGSGYTMPPSWSDTMKRLYEFCIRTNKTYVYEQVRFESYHEWVPQALDDHHIPYYILEGQLFISEYSLPFPLETPEEEWGAELRTVTRNRVAENVHVQEVIDLEIDTDEEEHENYVTEIGVAHNGGKRKGSCALYLSPWHVDFMTFIQMKHKTGDERLHAKDLFYGVWASDLFMQRVRDDKTWSFFCPNRVKGLTETWGTEFENLYLKYESEGKYSKQLPARVVMFEIIKAQIETGVPYMLYKDAINRKSMQSNIGIIRSSNLCAEIALHTSEKEIATCNLASVCLNAYVDLVRKTYNFDMLYEAVYELTENMNQVIDRNYYPEKVPQIRYANLKNRPIGIGVQGWADALALLDMTWEQPEALDLHRRVFETMYYASLRSSVDQAISLQRQYDEQYARERESIEALMQSTTDQELLQQLMNRRQTLVPQKAYYPAFPGSPYARGLFQHDLWLHEAYAKYGDSVTRESIEHLQQSHTLTGHISHEKWESLRRDMMQYGTRNSTLIAVMPTASSAHINRNTECMEPFNAVMSMRTLLSGQFTVFNHHLVRDLEKLGVWSKDISDEIIRLGGSIQDLEAPATIRDVPLKMGRFNHLKRKYKTVYELPQKIVLDMAIARGPFVCQTSSSNAHMSRPTLKNMYSYHMYGWKHGLKTGLYYLRSNPAYKARNIVAGAKDEEECVGCSA